MVGAFDAMWSGKVDRNWMEEHHDLYLREIEGERGDQGAHARRRGGHDPHAVPGE
jgi:formate dehydrogenase subunit gamma